MKEVTGLDINPEDRVFKLEGRYVKVRVKALPPPPGAPTFGVAFLIASGSETDKNGRALKQGDGYRIAAPEVHTIQSDGPVDLPSLLQKLRLETAEKTFRAGVLADDLVALLANS